MIDFKPICSHFFALDKLTSSYPAIPPVTWDGMEHP